MCAGWGVWVVECGVLGARAGYSRRMRGKFAWAVRPEEEGCGGVDELGAELGRLPRLHLVKLQRERRLGRVLAWHSIACVYSMAYHTIPYHSP